LGGYEELDLFYRMSSNVERGLVSGEILTLRPSSALGGILHPLRSTSRPQVYLVCRWGPYSVPSIICLVQATALWLLPSMH